MAEPLPNVHVSQLSMLQSCDQIASRSTGTDAVFSAFTRRD